MTFKKVWHKSYREFSVTMIRPNGDRAECYNGTVYRKESSAQAYADYLNTTPGRLAKSGRAIVESDIRPAGWSYVGTLAL